MRVCVCVCVFRIHLWNEIEASLTVASRRVTSVSAVNFILSL